MKSTAVAKHSYSELPGKEDFRALFDSTSSINPSFEKAKHEVGAALSALLAHSGSSRTEACEKLDWPKSRMSTFLGGDHNPTYKTLYEYANALGFKIDIIFRLKGEAKAHQPWQKAFFKNQLCYGERRAVSHEKVMETFAIPYIIESHTASEIADSYIEGTSRACYYTVERSYQRLQEIRVPIQETTFHSNMNEAKTFEMRE